MLKYFLNFIYGTLKNYFLYVKTFLNSVFFFLIFDILKKLFLIGSNIFESYKVIFHALKFALQILNFQTTLQNHKNYFFIC